MMKTKVILSIFGSIFFALGLNLLLSANIGLSPFDTLCLYISKVINISYANATLLVHCIVFIVLMIFRNKFKEPITLILFSLVSIFIITRFIEFFASNFVFYENYNSFINLILGLLTISLGSALILKSDLIISPTDKLVDGLSRVNSFEVGTNKLIVESTALILVVIGINVSKININLSISSIIIMFIISLLINIYDRLFLNKIKLKEVK